MIVVSDTTAICYLLLINEIHLLPELFGNVVIPEAVRSELEHKDAPELVNRWILQPPPWLKIQSVKIDDDPLLNKLHAGEREAIVLAKRLSADLILLDEKLSRQIAIEWGLNVTGLLGILDKAAKQGMINLPAAIKRLSQTNFRAAPYLLKTLLNRHSR